MTEKSDNPIVSKLREAVKPCWTTLDEAAHTAIKEVVAEIERLANERDFLATQEPGDQGPLPEAPASANVFMVDPATKANVQFTFRGHSDQAVWFRVTDFLKEMTGITPAVHWLTQNDYQDKKGNRVQQNQSPQPAQQPAQPPSGMTGGGNGHADPNQVMTCPALQLVTMQRNKDKPDLMWKVKTTIGQYATPIWEDEWKVIRPRLIEAGVDVASYEGKKADKLGTPVPDRITEIDLTGWTVHYLPAVKDGEVKPWPNKIVNLLKG